MLISSLRNPSSRQSRENPAHRSSGNGFAPRGSIIQVHQVKAQREHLKLVSSGVHASGFVRQELLPVLSVRPTREMQVSDQMADSWVCHRSQPEPRRDGIG